MSTGRAAPDLRTYLLCRSLLCSKGRTCSLSADEDRSNIYKLYRASRCGPDSSIDPREQVAFYDPGLGSQPDGGHVFGRLLRWIHNTVAQATGFGITRNIIDCYAALIQLWQPGDRIFLIVIWFAIHSAVGCAVTPNHKICPRPCPMISKRRIGSESIKCSPRIISVLRTCPKARWPLRGHVAGN
jgi:hypothetical protein